ncbi:hypothetical protein A2767_04870 [Candidatus Roizmanbacteria bacterium RIFCSPHIGHO2_01_FULL_35_10]|uniref:Uncharacterized protein n=1 Tax=Candidatus Roizmanbacteria bacterium RIFCSPLOWO2_01_FULL_35_13 TaxID=1802055 RepID=A0A1F7I791_9BACT|nr:MAG: hypothetical protein A2767_04870 [Candidatus Roizmanbacteria bacterium RIFCSPHIGHO2_01_FULL_35_10]OGK39203.1 MAG: hypothetical protein A3A74_07615 [Candidatus Roizmanbacteria bacterium RIFCSPLOWO2_01_FULL_35_13]
MGLIKNKEIFHPAQTGELNIEALEGKAFRKSTPPWTWVCENLEKRYYGLTVPTNTGVYKDPKDHTVKVIRINKRNQEIFWSIKPVLNMTLEEKVYHNIED